METVVAGKIFTEYTEIQTAFQELEAFLNIDEAGLCYQCITILKTAFIMYALDEAIPKFWAFIAMMIGNIYVMYMSPKLAIVAYITVILRFCDQSIPSTVLMYMLAMKCNSYEFLLDVFIVLCSLYYAFQAYKREIQKLCCIAFFGLFFVWYIKYKSSEPISVGTYLLILVALLFFYFPLRANNTEYRNRLSWFYVVIYAWIIYKAAQDYHRSEYPVVQTRSRTDVCMKWQHSFEAERCGLNATLENFEVKFGDAAGLRFFKDSDSQYSSNILGKKLEKETLIKTLAHVNQEKVTEEYKPDGVATSMDTNENVQGTENSDAEFERDSLVSDMTPTNREQIGNVKDEDKEGKWTETNQDLELEGTEYKNTEQEPFADDLTGKKEEPLKYKGTETEQTGVVVDEADDSELTEDENDEGTKADEDENDEDTKADEDRGDESVHFFNNWFGGGVVTESSDGHSDSPKDD